MRVRPRFVFATLVLLGTSCGLVYDVDSLSTDYKDCGVEGKRCCAKAACGDHLVCVERAPEGGNGQIITADSGTCSCSSNVKDSGSDAHDGGKACTCPAEVCTHCGYPGEPCCPDKVLPCSGIADLKCDATTNTCAGCGGPGEDCCKGNIECGSHLDCVAGKCGSGGSGGSGGNGGSGGSPSCGNSGEPCCGGTCNSAALACDGTNCVTCGAADGQLCCSGGAPCANQMGCFPSDGRCHPCGAVGLNCCPNVPDPCPNAGGAAVVCNPTGQCELCGGIGQRCCASTGPGTPCPSPILTCIGDQCISCCARCTKNGANAAAACVSSAAGDCSSAAVSYCQSLGQNYKNHFWTTDCGGCKF